MNRLMEKSRTKGRFIALAPMLLASALAMTIIARPAPAHAQESTPVTSITALRTGWNADSFAVVTSSGILNPANCSIPDGYISAKSLPGYQTYYEAALKAYDFSHVVVIVHHTNCYAGRPILIGINLVP